MLPPIAAFVALLVLAQAPAGWSDTQTRGSRLLLEGKSAEAIGLYEKVLQASPDFDEAHYALAEAHELAADNLKPQGASRGAIRRRHLETAAAHYRRVIDLRSAHAPMAMRSLAVIYGKDGLDRPVDAERFARQLVQARPTSAVWHLMLARLIFDQGRDADATDVLHKARSVVQAGDRNLFAIALADTVVERSALSPSLARILVEDALALAEQGLKSEPENRDLLMTKAAAFELLATRIETDPTRREAFKKEASNVFDRFHEIGLRERGVPKEWPHVQERTNDLQANGKVTEAVEVFQSFLSTYPDFGPAYASLGMAYLMLSPPPPPPPPPPPGGAAKPRTVPLKASPEQLKNFELARAAFQRSMDLAPPSDELPGAYLLLVQMYAPDALDRPAEREALLQTAITKYPTDPAGHFALIREKLAAGNVAAVDTLMKNARVAIPATYRGRLAMARAICQLVLDPDVRAPDARRLLTDAVAAIDEALKLEPKSPDALWQKSTILYLQAQRESDPQRARALRAESERLSARAKAGGGM
jgi:tetratricopeptide (TPR) repeat protein